MLTAEKFLQEFKTSATVSQLMQAYADYVNENTSSMIKTMAKVTRLEIIDQNGRAYCNWHEDNKFQFNYQDQNRTLKIFITKK